MKLLIIEGWPASGKATLWSMLDGHEHIYVEPLHSYFYEVIFKLFDDEHHERTIDIRTLRKCLADTEYYKYELYSFLGYYEMTAGKNNKLAFKFDFDFHKFDFFISQKISNNVAPLKASDLLNLMLTCYFDCLNIKKTAKYFVSMSNYFNYTTNKYNKFPSIVKVIQVQRDASEVYASRLARRGRIIDGDKDLDFAPTRSKMAKEAEIEEIITFDNYYRTRIKSYPKQYLQISLNDLINKKDDTLQNICSFLDIKFSSILRDGSRDGIRFETEVFQLTKKVNDNIASNLTIYAKIELYMRRSIYQLHGMPLNIFNFYSIIRFIYLKYRGLR